MTSKVLLAFTASLILFSIPVIGCGPGNDLDNSSEKITIEDMYGRKLEVPEQIEGVLTTGNIEAMMAFMVAPDLLLGWGFKPRGTLLDQQYLDLPVVGAWTARESGNYEVFIGMQPDIVLEGRQTDLAERQQKFGSIPVVGLDTGSDMNSFIEPIRYLGEILGRSQETELLVNYYEEALLFADTVKQSIPYEERVRVYYAEGSDGLSTDPSGSIHTELLDICGAINVAEVASDEEGYGMIDVSMEQVIMWDPDVIIIGRASPPDLRDTIMNDSRWRNFRAIEEGKVYTRPDDPFSWFDGPTGPNQAIGIYWLVHTLYPEKLSLDELKDKVVEFYSLFYHYELSEDELSSLLGTN